MVLTLKVLNEDASLNNFVDMGGTAQIVRGADAKLILELFQVDRKIRYVPISGAVISVDFLNSDGTTLSKTATFPFADDRSIIQIVLTDSETELLISQNIIASIVEGSNTSIAILQQGLQMVSTTQEGC